VATYEENCSNRPPSERYYTEHVQLSTDESTDEGADNERLPATVNQKIQRGWRLDGMVRNPSGIA
jgi:hypothetical protein